MELIVEDMDISPYLVDDRFSKTARELSFKLRSKTVAVKQNFNDMLFDLCLLFLSNAKS